MKLCIDPGHGGHDPGAVGPSGLEESETVLSVSKMVAGSLEEYGVETKLTRSSDMFIPLAKRCDIANVWQANYFVSIHANSNGASAKGIETLYASTRGKALAAPIQKAMVDATSDTDRGLKERHNLYVLNGTKMPAALAEIGFISNPATEDKLETVDYRHLLADAIFDGITAFLLKIK